MNILTQLSGLAMRGAGRAVCEVAGVGAVGATVDVAVGLIEQRIRDNSGRLMHALERSTRHTWRAVELALAGTSWWDRCRLTLASGDDRAIRAQVQSFLQANPLDGLAGHGPDFRGQCLAQLQAARKAGLLEKGKIHGGELARQVGDLSRFGDQTGLVDAERQALQSVAASLRQAGYAALADFLDLRPAAGPPLLLSALRYFFQREVEKDPQLFQGLAYARLDGLAEGQRAGFGGLAEAMDQLGDRLAGMLADVQTAVERTHADVLDVKSELARQGQQMRELGDAVLRALEGHQLARREVLPGDSLSVRDEDERRLVRGLVKRYRALPPEQRRSMPALLNAVGKLEVVTGDFAAAENDFRELATLVPDPAARAEAAHNAYRAALERRAWAEALAALRDAVRLDPARFAPFPADKFETERILGAGGFGVALLCRNRHSGARVVVKTLRREGLERDLGEVFREAQALEELDHPAIIRIRDCDYADAARTRPYLVMDYFEGGTLADHVEKHGPMPAADLLPLLRLLVGGLQRAHARGILHRDVKPGNILVRRGDRGTWDARLIDFGLALRARTGPSTQKASLDQTLAGSSIAGTLEYAAPEQMGRLSGVAVGPYSDVYGLARTCCFALFGTAQPTFQHWQKIPAPLAELLGRCLAESPRERPADCQALLRDLDALPRAGLAADARAAAHEAPILDAMPVEAAVPKTRVRAPAERTEVRPVERTPRRRRNEGDRLGDQKIRKLAILSIVIGSVGLIASLALLWITSDGQSPARVASPAADPASPVNPPAPPAVTPTPQTASPATPAAPVAVKPPDPPPPPPPPPKPFTEKELAGVIEELKKEPSLARLTEIATRLSTTEPTGAQKQARQEAEKKGNPADATDDITIVARQLNRLLSDSNSLEARKAGSEAAIQWATSDNVVRLIDQVGATGHGADAVRLNAAKALGRLRDPRGVAPVARRLEDMRDRSKVGEAVIAFGPMAEDEVLKALDNRSPFVRGEVIKVLKEIGTAKSIPALEKQIKDPFSGGPAQNAIDVIKARGK